MKKYVLLNSWKKDEQAKSLSMKVEEEIKGRKNRLEKGMVKLLSESQEVGENAALLLIPMILVNKLRGVIAFEIPTKNLEFEEKQLQIFRQLGDILAAGYSGSILAKQIERNANLLATTERLAKSGSWKYSTQKELFYISGGLAYLFGLGDQPLTAEFTTLIYKIDKSTRGDFVKKLKRSIREKSQESGEFTLINASGDTIYIEFEIESQENFLNQGIEVTGFCTDVTHKRASVENLKLQSQILAQVSDPIVVINLEMEVIYLNEAALLLCCANTAATFKGSVDDLLKGAPQLSEIIHSLGEKNFLERRIGFPNKAHQIFSV